MTAKKKPHDLARDQRQEQRSQLECRDIIQIINRSCNGKARSEAVMLAGSRPHRGAQQCSKRFQSLLKATGGLQSMSGTGCCCDNAITESFFGTLKRELAHRCSFKSRFEAQGLIFRCIEGFYNRQRRHSAIRYQSPENCGRLFGKRAA